jgi:hypothetical protein
MEKRVSLDIDLTTYLPKRTSPGGNRTVIGWCKLPNQRTNLQSLGENERFHSLSHHK